MEFMRYGESINSLDQRSIDSITKNILESNECLRHLQYKIDHKVMIKESADTDDGTNDYKPYKRLGNFIVVEKKLPDEMVNTLQKNGVDIYADELMEIHIPPQNITFSSLKNSFRRLGEYLLYQSRERSIPRYIYGITYLSKIATRWGFKMLELPSGIQEKTGCANLLKEYAKSINDDKKKKLTEKYAIGDVHLCYIDTDTIIGKFKNEEYSIAQMNKEKGGESTSSDLFDILSC